MWLATGAASAASLTWSITGGTFADGGTVSGTFVRNPADPRPSTWNLNVAGGGGSFPARSYTPADSRVLMLDWPPNTELTYHFIDTGDTGKRQLRLTPRSPLDGSVTSVPLSLLNGNAHVECFNCAPFRNITGGWLVLVSAAPALTLVSIAPDPVTIGATTTATVSIDSIAAYGPPTGAITIFDSGGNPKCSMTLPATSCTFAPTAPGGQTLHARYIGDANYGTATSNELSFTVVPAAVTTVTLDPVLPNPTMIGQATTATVHVATVPGYPPPTGLITVFFYGSGDTTLCTITLPATSCAFAPKTGGDQQVAAQYSGDANYSSGYSNSVVMTVAPVPPVVTLVSVAPNPTAVGTATTATVTVDTNPVFGPPTGTITVFDTSGNSLCTITLPATSCAFTPTTPGTQAVVARYDGDANYDNGLSNPRCARGRDHQRRAAGRRRGLALFAYVQRNAFPLAYAVTSGALPPGLALAGDGVLGGTPTTAGTFAGTVTGTVTASEHITGVLHRHRRVAPPTIAKVFGPPGILVGGTTTLTFTLINPNAGTALTGVAFTDTLPPGPVVATPTGASTCGGAVNARGPAHDRPRGDHAATGTCTFPVTVTATAGGLKGNTTSAVTSTEGGTGGSAVAYLVVVAPPPVAPPTIAKAFGAASIVVNGTTTLTFTLTNPNPVGALTGVGFTDTLPRRARRWPIEATAERAAER